MFGVLDGVLLSKQELDELEVDEQEEVSGSDEQEVIEQEQVAASVLLEMNEQQVSQSFNDDYSSINISLISDDPSDVMDQTSFGTPLATPEKPTKPMPLTKPEKPTTPMPTPTPKKRQRAKKVTPDSSSSNTTTTPSPEAKRMANNPLNTISPVQVRPEIDLNAVDDFSPESPRDIDVLFNGFDDDMFYDLRKENLRRHAMRRNANRM